MTTTVLLVDDHPVVRSGLRAVIDAGEAVQVIGEAATGEEAITLAAHLQPDVVLCDLRGAEDFGIAVEGRQDEDHRGRVERPQCCGGLDAVDPGPEQTDEQWRLQSQWSTRQGSVTATTPMTCGPW